MKSEFKFALLAIAEAVACVGLVGCGGAGGEAPGPTDNQQMSAASVSVTDDVSDVSTGEVAEDSFDEDTGDRVSAAAVTTSSWTKIADQIERFLATLYRRWSNARSPGSTDAAASPRTGKISTAARSHS